MKRLLLCLATILLLAFGAKADQVHLAWDAAEPATECTDCATQEPIPCNVPVDGYRIFYGADQENLTSYFDAGDLLDITLNLPQNVFVGAKSYRVDTDCEGITQPEKTSEYSNIVFYAGPSGILPATNLIVTQDCEIGQMAVERSGSIGYDTATGNYSGSITVPTSDILLVGCSAYGGSATPTATIGGQSMTRLGIVTVLGGTSLRLFYKTTPPTGTQTLVITTGTVDYSGIIFYSNYIGVDTSDPIVSSNGTGSVSTSNSTGTLTASSGDAVFVLGAGNVDSTSISFTNATELSEQGGGSSVILSNCGENFLSGDINVTVTTGGSGYNVASIFGVVLRHSTGTPSSALPMAMNLYRQMRN